MRKPEIASRAESKATLAAAGRDNSPTQVVCIALLLALIALGARIASIW